MKMIKFITFLFGSTYATLTTFAFGFVHMDDLHILTSMYICIGCAIAISLHVSHWYQNDKLQHFFNFKIT